MSDDVLLLWPFLRPSHLYQLSLVGCVGLRPECLLIHCGLDTMIMYPHAMSMNRTVAKILRFCILQVEGMSLSVLTLSTSCRMQRHCGCQEPQENPKRESQVNLHESEHLETLLISNAGSSMIRRGMPPKSGSSCSFQAGDGWRQPTLPESVSGL